MKKVALLFAVLVVAGMAQAQTSPCGAPTPGSPHVCLTFVASTTPGADTNIYRATVSKGENYAQPLNASPLPSITLFYLDSTCAIGTTCFYTAAAVGTGGVLSTPTAEVSAQIPVPPSTPTSFAAAID